MKKQIPSITGLVAIIIVIGLISWLWPVKRELAGYVGEDALGSGHESPGPCDIAPRADGKDELGEDGSRLEDAELNADASKNTAVVGEVRALRGREIAQQLLKRSELIEEKWTEKDAVGNRSRVAVYRTEVFKHPILRVEENWSGKTGDLLSQEVMVATHLIVKPNDLTSRQDFVERVGKMGFSVGKSVGRSGLLVSFEQGANDPDELPRKIAELSLAENLVEYAEPDYLVWPAVVPNDPAYTAGKMWGLDNPGRTNGYTADADIDAPEAWNLRTSAAAVIVSVTDTGTRYDHEDLADNMWVNSGEIPGDGIDNDGNGTIDDIYGLDAYDNDGDPMDEQGHGTHCAGTIGAVGNNSIGMTGVAWDVQLMVGRFLGPFGGTTSDGINVIDYSREMGADIISASWGGGGFSHALRDSIAACANANIPFVAAAGNSGTNNDAWPHYPSSYEVANVIAVAATDGDDFLTDFSCYGARSVDLAAPGWQIWSSFYGSTSDYKFLMGTSMATPHVSGALALAKAEFPDANLEELIARLYRSVDPIQRVHYQGGSSRLIDQTRGGVVRNTGAYQRVSVGPENRLTTRGRLNLYKLLTMAGPYLTNDQFDAPLVLTGDYDAWSGGNRDATREADEGDYSPTAGHRSIWFAWEAPYDGYVTLKTKSLGAGQQLVALTGDNRQNLQVLVNSGMPDSGVSETVIRFDAVAGTNYRFVTDSDSPTGELFDLTLNLVAANDLLSQAIVLEGESYEVEGSNRGATSQPFELDSPHAGVGAGKSVWYQWTSPLDGVFAINTDGSETDTVVAVYTGDPLNPAAFSTVAANDDVDASSRWSRVDFTAVNGTTYYIAVDCATGSIPGPFILRGAQPAAPIIVQEPLDQEIPFGGRALFTVGVDGTPPFTYQWFKDDAAIPGAWDTSLVIDPVVASSLATYRVEVSNTYGTTSSADATLSEKRFAPAIIWSSGNKTCLVGQDLTLGVLANGSQPMTYSWTKDGAALPGETQSTLPITGAVLGDAGLYACTVTNDVGSATESMSVSVLTNPFDSFAAVRDSAPNGPVMDLRVIGGKCYAVTGTKVLVSEDGVTWQDWMLPGGFDGTAITKLGSNWYCAGLTADGDLTMAVSIDGVNWNAPVPTIGIVADGTSYSQEPIAQLEVIGGRLVAAVKPRTQSGTWYNRAVYYSVDGINWSPCQHNTLSATTVDLRLKCRIQLWNGKLYAPSDNSISSVLISSDGITWGETALPDNGSGTTHQDGLGIGTYGSKLVLMHKRGPYTTEDGVTWTYEAGQYDSSSYCGRKLVSTGTGLYSFGTWAGQDIYKYGTSVSNLASYYGRPGMQLFTAATEFNGAVICGTNTGVLRRVEGLDDFSADYDAAYPLRSIRFLNEEFLAYRDGSPDPKEPVYVSGDGRRWRAMKNFSEISASNLTVPISEVYAGRRYFSGSKAGFVPGFLGTGFLPTGVSRATATANDGSTQLVVSSSSEVHAVNEEGTVWTPIVPTGLYASGNASMVHFNGRWLIANGSSVYESTDGAAWSQVSGATGSYIRVLGSKVYTINSSGSTLYESSDGLSWTSHPTGISVGSASRQTGSPSITLRRMEVFDDKLVVLVTENHTWRNFAFFTQDGVNWFNGNLPSNVVDFAVGRGSLVGVTSDGAVFVAGGTGAGGAAPVVKIETPAHLSTHVRDTLTQIRGSAIDPEGQAVTTECFVDGVSFGTSNQNPFRFDIRATSAAGHVVVIRSKDPSGLVGSDEIKIKASAPELTNSLESEEGGTYLPQVAWTSFGDRTYVVGKKSLYRTNRDGTWESVLMPAFQKDITNMVSGNGALIIQTSNRTYVTRDGYSWTELTTPSGGVIRFRNGYFIGYYYDQTNYFTRIVYSRDGLDWTMTNESNLWSFNPAAPTITSGGTILVVPANRSVDGGKNWIPIPDLAGINSNRLQFCVAFDAVFAGFDDGRVMRSDDEGVTWTQVAQFDPLPTGNSVRLEFMAGRLYWGGGGYWLASSVDGTTWNSFNGQQVQSSTVIHYQGRFVGTGVAGMVWSGNGHRWMPAVSGPMNPVRDMLVIDGGAVLMGDSNQGLWTSWDGVNWNQEMPGKTDDGESPTWYGAEGTDRILVGNTPVAGGTQSSSSINLLWYGTQDGLAWKPCNFHGGPFSNVIVGKVWSDGTTAFASTIRSLAENGSIRGLWRSRNGRNWEQLNSWTGGEVADMAYHNGVWGCLTAAGVFHTSSDSGETWSAGATPPGLLSGRLLTHFDGVWIVIGAEGANLQGPNVVRTSADGFSWVSHGAPGGETHYAKLGCAQKEGVLVLVSSSGKVFTTTDSNLVWTETAATVANYSKGHRMRLVQNLFCVPGRLVSADGVNWTTVNSSTVFDPFLYFNGRYISFPYGGIPRWSLDGIAWNNSNATTIQYEALTHIAGGVIRARGSSGSIWESTDGMTYTQVKAGVVFPSANAYGRRIVDFNGRLIVTGAYGLLVHSDDDGRSWQHGTLNGILLPDSIHERAIEVSPNEILATYHVNVNVTPPVCRHFRSTDGINWTEIADMAAQNVLGYAWGGGVWKAVCSDGSLLNSIDGGQTWSGAGNVPGVEFASRLTYYNGLWIVAATTTTGLGNIPIQLFTSPDGSTWTNRGDSGSFHAVNRETPPDFFNAHGKLVFGRQPSVNSTAEGPVRASSDGLAWQELGILGNARDSSSGTSGKTFIPTADGYLAIGGVGSSGPYYWDAATTAGTWAAIPTLQNNISWIATPDGQRVFLFGPQVIKEWVDSDLEMTITEPTPVNVGVGDAVSVNVTLDNRGESAISETVRVDAWLSTDRFFGDGNDTYVGWDSWNGAIPTPGATALESMTFTLPNTVRPGSFYLILQLNATDSFIESNKANNVAISESQAVSIAQHSLSVTTTGNGTVTSGINARYYAQGARVSIMAIPGKGARFSGWGGDAIGPATEVMLTMDSDKTVSASFDATALLTVHVRGGGVVTQNAVDGIHDLGATASLNAVASPGWAFTGWSGHLSGANTSESLLMDGNKVVTARFTMDFAAWKALRFSAGEQANDAVSDAMADPDHDGLENWREWLRGSGPKDFNDRGRSAPRRDGDWLIMTYSRLENMPSGHSVRCRASTNLSDWNAVIDERIISARGGVETIEVRMNVSGQPKAFFWMEDMQP